MDDYREFIRNKQRRVESFGFEPPKTLNRHAFPWQTKIVRWALKRGRAAIFSACGTGKTIMQLAWAEQVHLHTGSPVIVHTPVGVRNQTLDESEKFDISCPVKVVDDGADIINGINLVNYEKLHRFDTSKFAGVVLDECFPRGTLVDTPSGPVEIQNLRPGDRVLNASGVDVISDVHRREVKYGVAFTAGCRITTSPNHPVFTRRGWVASQDLEPGDCVLQTRASMRMVWRDIHASSVPGQWTNEVLREILLSEMADESTGALSESPYSRSCGKERCSEIEMVCVGMSGGPQGEGKNGRIKPDDRPRSQEEGEPYIETHEAQTFRAWRKRSGNDNSAVDFTGCTRRWVGSRIEHITGEANSGLSNELQSRLGEYRAKSSYRGGWKLPLQSQTSRCEEGLDVGFVRVESLEILEQGNPELEKLRDADGKLYFYDIGATRHPSFSVGGLLVHNSSVLKAFSGKIKQELCDRYANTPFRLACTATPAPNDHKELGNHSQFLGVMPSSEMLSRWFINDTMKAGGYRLKHHAADDFWAWVASWAICISKPSDIGGDDTGYELPPLNIHRHVVEVKEDNAPEGFLFNTHGLSATNIHEAKRLSQYDRAEFTRKLVDEMLPRGPVLIWCETDYEADELLKRLPEASEVRGSQPEAEKIRKLEAFSDGESKLLITKPGVAGFGMNWQHCNQMIFAGLSFSFERFYQAIRRCWRFGQQHPVDVHLVLADSEHALEATIARKESDFALMQSGMAKAMRQGAMKRRTKELRREKYEAEARIELPGFLKDRKKEMEIAG